MFNIRPTEAQVREVMRLLGFDYLVAYRHVQQRLYLQAQARRRPDPYPLGKTAMEM